LTHSSLANGEHALALTKIGEWFNSPKTQVFRLFGLAGTGKTTLAREVAAFAGKAAMALRQRGCLSATTIHSLIYNVVEDYTAGTRRTKTGTRAHQLPIKDYLPHAQE
jgi:hypothetical protein